MSDISELEGRLSSALERIARGVDAMQAVVAEPDEGDDVQALRRALENEALVTAQMEERVRALTARQDELEEELSAEKEARAAAETASETAGEAAVEAALSKAAEEHAQALMAAEARAEAAETAAAAAADKLEELQDAAAEAPTETNAAETAAVAENRALLDELAKRLRRLRQMVRRERGANQQLRDQVEKGEMVELSTVTQALQADLATLTALREAEITETALILAELRPLVQGGVAEVVEVVAPAEDTPEEEVMTEAREEAGDV
ncbi:hypothetical protein J7382_04780 [Shimia sp. R11_0]|uniref:hypothetical protein n=1 Tax=Shimia sp. R11_0 TaxID=2821096 RepID=UPI001ADB3809|nr:hypothetical protein [Shimia sp. R11_0]MBO9476844.1 hypothetical protein [Shimia sp. R11_0]